MRHVGLPLLLLCLTFACGSDSTLSEQDARDQAELLTGGDVQSATRIVEDGYDLWELDVLAPNSAELEVLFFASDGALFEIKDLAGPFDYDSLDPLPGQLTYAEARAIAFERVAGTQEAWEVKYTTDGYFYEFYVRESVGQLWEIKLWSDTGEIFVVEAKDAVD